MNFRTAFSAAAVLLPMLLAACANAPASNTSAVATANDVREAKVCTTGSNLCKSRSTGLGSDVQTVSGDALRTSGVSSAGGNGRVPAATGN